MRDKIICGFLQEKLLDFKGVRYETRKKKIKGKETSYKKEIEIKLDVSDAHILQKVSKFMMNPRGNAMFDDRIFTIIKYDIIVENLPLLNLTVKGLRERFKKYVILGALEMKMKKHPKTGTKTYYSLTEKLYKCIDGFIDESEVNEGSKEELLTGSKEELLTGSKEELLTGSDKHYNKHLENTTTGEDIKNSSSSLENIFKKHNFDISDLNIKNIKKLNFEISKIEEYLKYTISQKKGIGYLIKSLKENWDITPLKDKEIKKTKTAGIDYDSKTVKPLVEYSDFELQKNKLLALLGFKFKREDLIIKAKSIKTVEELNKFCISNSLKM